MRRPWSDSSAAPPACQGFARLPPPLPIPEDQVMSMVTTVTLGISGNW